MCRNIFPPTGVAHAEAVLAGIPKTAKDSFESYEAIVLTVANNVRLQINTPEEGGDGGGISAWRSSKFAPEIMVRNVDF